MTLIHGWCLCLVHTHAFLNGPSFPLSPHQNRWRPISWGWWVLPLHLQLPM